MTKSGRLVVLFCSASVWAGAQSLDPDEIIRRVAQNESQLRLVWAQYMYRQNIAFQVLNAAGRVAEQREIVVEIYFSKNGERNTRVLQDRGALKSVVLTDEDLDNAVNIHPFALSTAELPNYEVKYLGRERVDELGTYVFDLKPHRMPKGKRYFRGRIWVDDLDYQVVMTKGRPVPETANNKFPEFETVREQIDENYWFPTWSEADEVLYFNSPFGRNRVHVRELMTFENYRKFDVDTSVTYGPVQGGAESEEKEDEGDGGGLE